MSCSWSPSADTEPGLAAGDAVAAAQQLRNLEQRVLKLRQSNLDADPQVMFEMWDSRDKISMFYPMFYR